jgi:hypothetical protein
MKWGSERHWTSGTNLNCKTGYYWCSVNQTLYTGISWKEGEPNNHKNIEWAAELRLNTGADSASILNDLSNNTLLKPICEVSFFI